MDEGHALNSCIQVGRGEDTSGGGKNKTPGAGGRGTGGNQTGQSGRCWRQNEGDGAMKERSMKTGQSITVRVRGAGYTAPQWRTAATHAVTQQ